MQSMYIILFSLIFICGNFLSCYAETSGEDLYYRGSYLDAESYFREMDMNNPKDVRWRYNRGCAAYKSDQMEASLSAFNSVTKRSKDPELLFRSTYNAGNILFKNGDFASAAQLYTQALKIKPDDEDARYNLSLALVKKKAAQQEDKDSQCNNPKEGDQNNDSQKNDQQNQQNKDSEQKDQNKQNKDSKSQENAQNKDQNKDKKDNDQSQQNANNKKQEEKPDLSKELKAAQAMPEDQKKQGEQSPEEKAQKMAVLKAQALLDNIQEDRSIQMKQMKAEGKEDARSGKHW